MKIAYSLNAALCSLLLVSSMLATSPAFGKWPFTTGLSNTKAITNVGVAAPFNHPATTTAGENINTSKPLSFIENKGQVTDQHGKPRKDIQFKLAAANGLNIFIGNGAIHYQFSKCDNPGRLDKNPLKQMPSDMCGETENTAYTMYRMDVELIGANKHAQATTAEKQEYYENYYTAGTGESGVTAQAFNRIVYREVYPHIDWVLYTRNGELKHEFRVHPGGKVSDIKLKYVGATSLKIDNKGALVATTPQGRITEQAPYCYEKNGRQVASRFRLNGKTLSYEMDVYSGDLVIDPGLVWATYYGGSGNDYGFSTATDNLGNVYLAGHTESTSGIATSGSHQSVIAGSWDAFLIKFNNDGVRMWSTYYGASNDEGINALAIDAAGNTYATGTTKSTVGIATIDAHQSVYGGGTYDAFLTKFNSSGIRQWCTYYGGPGNDMGYAVKTDVIGNVYVAGGTFSLTGIATAGAQQNEYGGGPNDAFLVKFNGDGMRQWGTYYGGNDNEHGYALSVDASDNVFLTGITGSSTGIASSAAHQTLKGGMYDAFIAKFNSSGNRLWSTYYGGDSDDEGKSLVATATGVFLAGHTKSTSGIATTGAHQNLYGGGEYDAFLVKFDNSGVRQWGSYYGGAGNDYRGSIAVDVSGDVYLTGATTSLSSISAPGGWQNAHAGGIDDAFLVKLSSTGVRQWSTYYGGTGLDGGEAVVLDALGNVYLAGYTTSLTGISSEDSHQETFAGAHDAFLVKFTNTDISDLDTITGTATVCLGSSTTLHNTVSSGIWSSTNPLAATVSSLTGVVTGIGVGTSTISYTVSGISTTITVTVNTIPVVAPISGPSTLNTGATTTLTSATPGGLWFSSNDEIATIDSYGVVTGISPGFVTFAYVVTNSCGTVVKFKYVDVFPPLPPITGTTSACAGSTTTLSHPTPGGTWSSSNTGIATVSTSTGVVTGVSGGTAAITYTVPSGIVATAVITVNPLPDAGTITGPSVVTIGSAIMLSNATPSGVWSSSNPAVGSVSATGIVSGLAAGTTLVSYTVTNGCGSASATKSIVVQPVCTSTITTIAGTGSSSYNGDGIAANTARLNWPYDVAVDAAGNIYIGDDRNHRVRKITPAGIITTIAGTGTAGYTGDGGLAVSARINQPEGIFVDGTGNVFFADFANNCIRKISTSGIITTVAGSGTAGYSGDGGSATLAKLNAARNVYVDAAGNVYIADQFNHRVRKVNTEGIISTIAGTGTAGFTGNGGPATAAKLDNPNGIAADNAGNLFISESNNHCVRKIDAAGTITLYAGTGTGGYSGDGGPATAAQLNVPHDVYADAYGNIFIGEINNNRVRKVDVSGIMTTVAGSGISGFAGDGGAATGARFNQVMGIGGDAAGNIYVADHVNHRLRKISGVALPGITGLGAVCVGGTDTLSNTLAGGAWSSSNALTASVSPTGVVSGIAAGTAAISYTVTNGCGTGSAVKVATVNTLPPVAGVTTGASSVAAGATIILANTVAGGIWSSAVPAVATVSAGGVVTGVAAGTATISYTVSNGCGSAAATKSLTVHPACTSTINTIAGTGSSTYNGDGMTAGSATLNWPVDVAIDAAGNKYIGDDRNHRVRKISPENIISTLAGTGSAGYGGDGAPAASATLNQPQGVCADAAGNVYFADLSNHRIRKISTSGIITTIAGTGTGGYSGDGGSATLAKLGGPKNIAVDAAGNVYIADYDNNRVRMVNTAGIISTVAGTGTPGYNGDGGPATAAHINGPAGLALDNAGNILIADANNNRIRKIDGTGTITTFAGTGAAGFGGDGGPATAAMLNVPHDVAADAHGNIYISEIGGQKIRRVTNEGIISTIAGSGATGFSGDGGNAVSASFNQPTGIGVDLGGNVYITDHRNHRLRKISGVALPGITGLGAVCVGGTDTLSNTLAGGAWSSSNALTASVSPTGVVSGIAAGTAVISYTVTNGCGTGSAVKVATVNTLPPVAGVTTGASSVAAGATIILANTVAGGVWSSAVPAVATVSAGGVVTGLATGTATISYTVSNGCGSAAATKSLTVHPACNATITTIAGTGPSTYNGDGIAASAAALNWPFDVAVDAAGNIYVGDDRNHRIRKITPAGIITTVAGTGSAGFSGDGGLAVSAKLNQPEGLYVDAAGNIFFADFANNCIRKVSTSGIITTVAGNGTAGYSGDGGSATVAKLNGARNVTTDAAGNIYIADQFNHRVRKVNTEGIITTIAGTGAAGFTGNDGPATAAMLDNPAGIAADIAGNLYIAETNNDCIRKINAAGIITLYAGTGATGYGGDGGPATAALMNVPNDVYADAHGNIFIGEIGGHRVRKVSSEGIISTVAGTGTVGFAGDGGPASAAKFNKPMGICCDASGNIYVADHINHRIRKISGVALAGITGSGALCVGGTDTISSPDAGGVWSSSNTLTATVNTTGVVSGIAAGTAVISYAVTTGCGTGSAVKLVTVNGLPNAGTISGPSAVVAGSSITLVSSVTGGIWASSVTAIATVNSSGVVTGVAEGTVTISYTVANDCGSVSAAKVVTVNIYTPGHTDALWATYMGHNNNDEGYAVATDDSGNIYMTGVTTSVGISTPGAFQTSNGGGEDAFIAKFSSTGLCKWITYYGGSGHDQGYALAIDKSGNVYMSGRTRSEANIATPGAHQSSHGNVGSFDAFLVKFSCVGNRLWATYYGGEEIDEGYAVAVDTAGNVYMTGRTKSESGIASTAGFQTNIHYNYDAFLVKFNSTGVRLWGTYYGGMAGVGDEYCSSLAINRRGDIYMAGSTNSTLGIATFGTHQTSFNSTTAADYDAFLVRFDTNGMRQWATYFGGEGNDESYSISADTSSNVYLVGKTGSATNIATAGVFADFYYGGLNDAFLAKFDDMGMLSWATYYGGVQNDEGYSVAVKDESVYIAGKTASNANIATSDAFQSSYMGNTDAFLACFNSLGIRSWGTYYGSNENDEAYAIAIDKLGSILLAGQTASPIGIASVAAYDTVYDGNYDAFLVKFNRCIESSASITGPSTVNVSSTITLSNSTPGGTWSSSTPSKATVSSTGVVTGVSAGTATISYTVTNSCGSATATKVVTVNGSSCMPTDGLIAWYPFNGSANDESGNGNHLTNFGATLSADRFGNTNSAFHFDGNDMLQTILPDSVSPAAFNQYSYSLWFKNDVNVIGLILQFLAGTSSDTVISAYDLFTNHGYCSPGHIAFQNYPFYNPSTCSPAPVPTNEWSNICVVIDHVTHSFQLYKNGLPFFTGPVSNTPPNSGYLTVGNNSTAIFHFTGSIDDIAIYSRALSTAEVAQLYNGGTTLSGPSVVNIGATIGLTPSISGGTWSSSTPSKATVNATGVVTGISAGTATISYTVTNSCGTASATKVVTVSAGEGTEITGTLSLCHGATSTLSNSTPGGTWSSSNTAVATISAGGVVSGVSVGTAVVSYITASAISTAIVTVNALPGAISGDATVCVGQATMLSGDEGGTWGSSNPAAASVHITSGLVTGLSAGTVVITFTSAAGCIRTHAMTIHALPAAISGSAAMCTGGSVTLTNAGAGTWSSGNADVATVPPMPGVVTGVSAGTATITFRLTATGCVATRDVTVNALPSAISGPSTICVSGAATYSCAPAGGTWSAGGSSAITLDVSTGAATGNTAGNLLITYSAGGCTATSPVTVSPLPATITGTFSVCVASTTTVASTTAGGTWTSANTSVATAGSITSASGFVNGIAPGTATIRYTAVTGCSRSTVITVTAAPAISGADGICIGGAVTLTAGTGGTWATSAPAIATVSATGVVTAVSAGMANITYRFTATCLNTKTITVATAPADPISGPASVCTGATIALTHAVSGGTWASSNTARATVSATGAVTGGASTGTVNITYTLDAGCIRVHTVTVSAPPNAITGTAVLCAGATTTLNCTTPAGTWACTDAAATISPTGIVTGVTGGTATVSYATGSGCASTRMVTVNATPDLITGSNPICVGAVQTYSTSPAGGTWGSSSAAIAPIGFTSGTVTGSGAGGVATISYTLPTGCKRSLAVTVNGLPGAITGTLTACAGSTTTLNAATAGLTWSSGNPSVASVSTLTSISGLVTGLTAGTAAISYTNTAGCSRVVVVTVSAGPAAIMGNDEVCIGGTSALTNATSGGTWSSSTTATATITAAGVVTGVAVGTATITYKLGATCMTTRAVSVVSSPAVAITGPANVCVGTSITLAHASPGGTWSSGNTGKAVVSSTGLVTGVFPGAVTITYHTGPGCFRTHTVNVFSAVPAISPIGGPASVCEGSVRLLSNATAGGTWSSAVAGIATVVASVNPATGQACGAATGVSEGTVIITYTNPGSGCYSMLELTVNPIPAAITSTVEPLNLVAPSTALLSSATPGGSWSSSASGRASVGSSSGIVTAVAAGTATISYRLTATGCARTRVVTVLASRPNDNAIAATGSLIAIYPSPSSGMLTVEAPVNGRFVILTIDNRKIAAYQTTAPSAAITLPYNLAAGIYMCRFEGEDGSIEVAKIVYTP